MKRLFYPEGLGFIQLAARQPSPPGEALRAIKTHKKERVRIPQDSEAVEHVLIDQ